MQTNPHETDTQRYIAAEQFKRELASLGIDPESAIAFLRSHFPVKLTESK